MDVRLGFLQTVKSFTSKKLLREETCYQALMHNGSIVNTVEEGLSRNSLHFDKEVVFTMRSTCFCFIGAIAAILKVFEKYKNAKQKNLFA